MLITGWILFGLAAVWIIPAIAAMILKQLPPGCPTVPDLSLTAAALPFVSVIVPARNEGAAIERALKSILASTGVRLELLVINDRSTDDTGAIMDAIAATDARVRVIHITELPAHWLGKNHAMHVAAEHATGEFLLFTDGDVIYETGAIAAAVSHVHQHKLQHLCLLPRMIRGGAIENSVTAFFGFAFAIGMQPGLIRTRWPLSYAGVGAFNLIDAGFYRRLGGHLPIRLDVLDDVKLGKMVKKNGGISDFQFAPDLLSIRWQDSLWGVIRGLEKNGLAALGYSVWQVFLCTVAYLTLMILPYAAAVWLPLPAAAGFIGIILLWHTSFGVASVLSRGGWYLFPLFPVAASLMAFAFLRSTWITLRQGGVRWRDSFYPLSILKPNLYR